MIQFSTPSAQLELRSELFDWYRDATSVPYGKILIDLSPRTDNRLRYCMKNWIHSLKIYITDRLNQSKILEVENAKSLYTPSVPIFFPQLQKSFPSVLLQRVYPVSLRKHNKSAQREPAKPIKTSFGEISQQFPTFVSKTYDLEAKKRHSGILKCLHLIKVITPPVIISLT